MNEKRLKSVVKQMYTQLNYTLYQACPKAKPEKIANRPEALQKLSNLACKMITPVRRTTPRKSLLEDKWH